MSPPRAQLRTLSLAVEGYAVATSSLDDTLDAISLEVEEALAADLTQNSLARDTRVSSVEIEYSDEGEQPVGVVRVDVEIDYVAAETDLENAA